MRNKMTEKTVLRNGIVSVLALLSMLILCVMPVIAVTSVNDNPLNSVWGTWGNAGIQFSATQANSYLFFGSNFPAWTDMANVNFTTTVISQGTDISPLVADFDLDNQNEIIIASSGILYAYDNTGQLTDSYGLNGSVCGQPCYSSVDETGSEEIVVMMKTGLFYNMYFLNLVEGAFVLKRKSNAVGSVLGVTPSCYLSCGSDYSYPNEIYTPLTNSDILVYDYETEDQNDYDSGLTQTLTTLNGIPYINGGISASVFTNGGYTNLCYIAKTSAENTYKVVLFDTNSRAFNIGSWTGSATSAGNHTCTIANIGAAGAQEVITTESQPAQSVRRFTVWDSSLTSKLELAGSGTVSSPKGLYAVADINHDGANEVCYLIDDRMIDCYNSAYALTMRINLTSGSNISGYFAIADFDNSNNMSEIITNAGIFKVTNGSNTTIIHDFGLFGSTGAFAPVRIQSRTQSIQDLLFYSTTQMILYSAAGQPTVCPNSVCELGENVFNCAADCLVITNETALNETIGFLPTNADCFTDTDCYSGKCVAYMCEGLPQGASCNASEQCSSGTCNNQGFCTKVDIIQGTNNFLALTGWGSPLGKMLFSFVIIIALMILGGYYLGFLGAGLGAFIGICSSTLVFGWLAIWFLFSFVLVIIALVFLGFIFGIGTTGDQ